MTAVIFSFTIRINILAKRYSNLYTKNNSLYINNIKTNIKKKNGFSILLEVAEIVRITQQLVTLITSVTINKRCMSI